MRIFPAHPPTRLTLICLNHGGLGEGFFTAQIPVVTKSNFQSSDTYERPEFPSRSETKAETTTAIADVPKLQPLPPVDPRLLLRQKIAAGLLLGLFFSLSLIALGYAITLSLGLALVGSAAGVFMVSWWYDFSAIPAPPGYQSASGQRFLSRRRRTNAPGIEEAQRRRRLADAARNADRATNKPGQGRRRSRMARFFRWGR